MTHWKGKDWNRENLQSLWNLHGSAKYPRPSWDLRRFKTSGLAQHQLGKVTLMQRLQNGERQVMKGAGLPFHFKPRWECNPQPS